MLDKTQRLGPGFGVGKLVVIFWPIALALPFSTGAPSAQGCEAPMI